MVERENRVKAAEEGEINNVEHLFCPKVNMRASLASVGFVASFLVDGSS